MAIRLVTFDAMHTLLVARLPVYVQYSRTFEPYLGILEPGALKKSFKTALKQLQQEKPVYQSGATGWWGEVIRRTAVGAGADPQVVDRSLAEIVPRLLHCFSSREGYKLFDDSMLALKRLKEVNVHTGLISNTDVRMHRVLADLGVHQYLDVTLLSEEEGIEKPSREIFLRACSRVGVKPQEAVHVGDELRGDYRGAKDSGMSAFLLRRPGPEGEWESKEDGENLAGVDVVPSLLDVVEWVKQRNGS
ncbi:Putative uncharacterized hydrolase [Sparassis crispa]|uniref:Uncharacterized hydrolase n=1 Tax=Sparassis crispa TaxID=139825 RepID=A0A401GH37_9APHY|nr:Putative uncharacterized hydrolase [Sparassis crispa]GBE81490.1 Putative uncharacterized hydrolase [Sparassis crispa]